MNDKLIIEKFLNANYIVQAMENDFMVADIDSGQLFNVPAYLVLFKDIIGEFEVSDSETSIDVFHKWYDAKKAVIAKSLYDYFETLDGSVGSNILGEQVFNYFIGKSEFHHNFVKNYFNAYYSKKFLKPVIEKYLASFDKNKFSGDLIEEFASTIIGENMTQYDYAIEYLNNWYMDEVLEAKVNDLLSQFVVTLGRTNWIVTWVGHGPVTDISFQNYFKKENAHQFRYAKGMYERWYTEAVQDKSERLMAQAMSPTTFTTLGAMER